MRRNARSLTADFSAAVLIGRRIEVASRSAIRRSLLVGDIGVESANLVMNHRSKLALRLILFRQYPAIHINYYPSALLYNIIILVDTVFRQKRNF